MKRYRIRLAQLSIILLLFGLGISSVPAYTMSDYFPLAEGEAWEFDRNLFLVSGDQSNFGGKIGRYLIDARSFIDGGAYLYSGDTGVLILAVKDDGGSTIDLSATPIALVSAEMNVGDSRVSVIPAGKLGPTAITVTSTLLQVEPTLTVPAGTFTNTLKIRLVIDEVSYAYTEYLWLAKNVGLVKIQRGSYDSYDGACFLTCGCFDADFNIVQVLSMNLKKHYIQSSYKDTDSDGVIDDLDMCVNTPANSLVDAQGCPGKVDPIVVPLPL